MTLTWALHVTHCAEAKSKAKTIAIKTDAVAQKPAERIFLDISGPYTITVALSKYWVLLVNDFLRCTWSFFIPRKKDLSNVVDLHLMRLCGLGFTVKFLHCDNVGRNVSSIQTISDQGV